MTWFEDPGDDSFRGLSLSELDIDEAYLNVSSQVDRDLFLYTLSEDCYKCPYQRLTKLQALDNTILTMSTKRATSLRILKAGVADTVAVDDTSQLLCDVSTDMGEFGVYDLKVTGDTTTGTSCVLDVSKDPVSIYLPILFWFLVILGLVLLYKIGVALYRRTRRKNVSISPATEEAQHEQVSSKEQPKEAPRRRLRSIDTFRGISIVVMIFVNDGAGGYWFLEHATWNGLQVADLVFPWFLWIMGVCIPISIRSQLKKKINRGKIIQGVLRRACILFMLGLILNTNGVGPNLQKIRIFGVLQRFGITYFVVASLAALTFPRDSVKRKNRIAAALEDVIVLLPLWVVMLSVVIAHCCIIFLLEVPNCPAGYLGPGGIQDNSKYFHCAGGATGYIDRQVLGDHLYKYPTSDEVYRSGPFDPEGILGCLTSFFQVFMGVQAGAVFMYHKGWKNQVSRWIIWGILTGVVAACLCLGSKEDGVIPINKNLWSLSFVMVTSCFAFFLLTICFVLTDLLQWWNGAPFYHPGMNPIIMYVGHSLGNELFPWHWVYGRMNTHFHRLIEAVWGTSLWVLIAAWLFSLKFFLSI